jgi:hypothetical protein
MPRMEGCVLMSEQYSLVIDIEDDGQTIGLDDGSTWKVPPGDNTISICWYATQRIVVEESGDKNYPYRLRNLDTSGDVVKAIRLT